MRRFVPALACLILAACATPREVPDPTSLFVDTAFQVKAVPKDPDLFTANDAMRRYLAVDIAAELRVQGKLRGLVSALGSDRKLKLEYDGSITRTASEAFAARAGNCLSLTVMTAALARELGISVTFHRVLGEPLWTRDDDILIASGHVNIELEPTAMIERPGFNRMSGLVVDFMPGVEIRRQRSQQIEDRTVVAMYMNNRAAESMRAGSLDLDEAYWWARGAIGHDPRFLEAVNTLGVIYSRHGDTASAERAFRHVLAAEADNVSALANLVGILRRTGRQAESVAFVERLHRIEAHPPFHFYDLGVDALKRHEYAKARDHFLSELRRNAYYHLAHYGLALAYFGLGETRSAREHLRLAEETSTNRRDQNLYAAKLAWLKAQAAQ